MTSKNTELAKTAQEGMEIDKKRQVDKKTTFDWNAMAAKMAPVGTAPADADEEDDIDAILNGACTAAAADGDAPVAVDMEEDARDFKNRIEDIDDDDDDDDVEDKVPMTRDSLGQDTSIDRSVLAKKVKKAAMFAETEAEVEGGTQDEAEDDAADDKMAEDDGETAESDHEDSGEPPMSAMAAARALDNERDIEDDEELDSPNLSTLLFGKQFNERARMEVRKLAVAQKKTKAEARQLGTRISRESFSSAVLRLQISGYAVAQTSLAEADQVSGLDEKKPGTPWGQAVLASFGVEGSQRAKELSRLFEGVSARQPHGRRFLSVVAMMLYVPENSHREVVVDDESYVALHRVLPKHENFVHAMCMHLQKMGAFPKAKRVEYRLLSEQTWITVLPKYLLSTGKDCEAHGLFQVQPATRLPDWLTGEKAQSPVLAAKGVEVSPPAKKARIDTNAINFEVHNNYATGTVTATHEKALRYSVAPVLRAQGIQDKLVLVPDDTLVYLLHLRDKWVSNPHGLSQIFAPISQKAPGPQFNATRMLVAANCEEDGLQWVKKARVNLLGDNKVLDQLYEGMGAEAFELAHVMAGFLRADTMLSKSSATPRVQSRRVVETVLSETISHAIALPPNYMLVEYDLFVSNLFCRVYGDMFSRYLREIGFDADITDVALANHKFEELRSLYARKNPNVQAAELACMPGTDVDNAVRQGYLQRLLPVVACLFPARNH